MNQQLKEISEQQKASWNKSSPGWKKWDQMTMDFLKPVGDEIIRQLNLRDTHIVLDAAAGTGEPGLTIASKLKKGKVIINDLSNDMLAIAKENAAKREIKNVEFSASDICELPFPDNTFDAISCRMGFMFFPDMLLAAKEMFRVLKPGGGLGVSVWNTPEKNFWVASTLGVIKKNMDVPSPPPGSPGMFRCAKSGLMADLFSKVGLKNITEKEILGKLDCKTADTFWSFSTEVVGPIVSALSQADESIKNKIKHEVYQLVREKCGGENIKIDSSAQVIYGQK